MSRFICTRLAQLVVLSAGLLSTRRYMSAQEVLGPTAEAPAAFEAASIKLNTGSAPYYNDGPGQFEMRNYPLIILIFKAYGVNNYSLSGPEWLGTVKVDLVAKLPASLAGLSPKDRALMMRPMLQALLAERFKLKVHREEKLIPGYALVVAPGSPKMRRVETTTRGAVMPGSIAGTAPIGQIVASVSGTLNRPVKDMTGLSGNYEVNLKWTPEAAVLAGADNTSTPPDDRPPSIFTALREQLGLRLEPQNFPMQIVVVDHIERVPTEN
jgi:uncharacterized protein (TIGR03435 family)